MTTFGSLGTLNMISKTTYFFPSDEKHRLITNFSYAIDGFTTWYTATFGSIVSPFVTETHQFYNFIFLNFIMLILSRMNAHWSRLSLEMFVRWCKKQFTSFNSFKRWKPSCFLITDIYKICKNAQEAFSKDVLKQRNWFPLEDLLL